MTSSLITRRLLLGALVAVSVLALRSDEATVLAVVMSRAAGPLPTGIGIAVDVTRSIERVAEFDLVMSSTTPSAAPSAEPATVAEIASVPDAEAIPVAAPSMAAAITPASTPLPAATEPPATPRPTPAPVVAPVVAPVPVSGASAELRTLALMNSSRVLAGIGPLVLDAGVSGVARAHSAAEARAGYVYHDGPDGTARSRNVAACGSGWYGENTGKVWGGNVDALHNEFMAEPLTPINHHTNIVDPNFRRVGIGATQGPDALYLTMVFCR